MTGHGVLGKQSTLGWWRPFSNTTMRYTVVPIIIHFSWQFKLITCRDDFKSHSCFSAPGGQGLHHDSGDTAWRQGNALPSLKHSNILSLSYISVNMLSSILSNVPSMNKYFCFPLHLDKIIVLHSSLVTPCAAHVFSLQTSRHPSSYSS